jgi:hypothetical protein
MRTMRPPSPDHREWRQPIGIIAQDDNNRFRHHVAGRHPPGNHGALVLDEIRRIDKAPSEAVADTQAGIGAG